MRGKIYEVAALLKAYEILDFLLVKGEATFTEIHTSLGHPKSSTYKTISTLESLGLVRMIGQSNHYALGLRLIELGAKAANQVDMTTEAKPILRTLSMESRRTCHLGILDGSEVVYLLKENVYGAISLDTWAGKRLGVHCTAMGKVLLAWLPEKEVDRVLAGAEFTKYTPNTVTTPEEVKRALIEVRARGWAIDDEESNKMVRCVAAPVLDSRSKVCAAMSVTTLTDLDNYEQLLGLTNMVVDAANSLSKKIGSHI